MLEHFDRVDRLDEVDEYLIINLLQQGTCRVELAKIKNLPLRILANWSESSIYEYKRLFVPGRQVGMH